MKKVYMAILNLVALIVVILVASYFIDDMTIEGARWGLPLGLAIGISWALGFACAKMED